MIRTFYIPVALVLAIVSSGCSTSFTPIEPEARPTTIDALDRADRDRLDAQRTHPECRERTTDDKDFPRRCTGQQRPR
ncbi:MAG: hypothetical protein Q7U72_16945 [Brevundimonas sp.]|uniref:hypothetical protein n=1 Tax=Brevundimonas sp. TaxID=1871086 RepID=UPI0027194259|nr:hypothetical protein [Brevundimonas sp.]MDO9079122.1 hypothetical protein [Brevundimonas sp.]MDP3081583.1 hypothetical protein [Brevundimonas sp.]MDZ4062204.1 hypothetical protein [Brevundimonas sp.]